MVQDFEIRFVPCDRDVSSLLSPNFPIPNMCRDSPPTIALKRGTVCRGRKLDQYYVLYRKRCKIGSRLLSFTHAKSHTVFPLVPELVTLNDLERPNGR